MLAEAKRLYDLGFAVHVLHAKSKRPVEAGWGKGPRKSWEHIENAFFTGCNLGVRLGTPSLIDGRGYLAVIDVDVKSSEPHHKEEALGAARKLTDGHFCPVVTSGRGNGSRHYYCVTESPFKTFNPAESPDKVKVHMPSKKPSKHEIETLTPAEIESGLRIANAWEISLYSDGRQVVLPPSIHPDSGKAYRWKHPFVSVNDFPVLAFAVPEESEPEGRAVAPSAGAVLQDFEIDNTVNLEWLPVSPAIKAAIIDGVGVKDRSAHLLPATAALISAGCSKNEILTVLTEPDYFLGACAYDHAKTKSRRRAASWLWTYTVKRVMEERDGSRLFGPASGLVKPPALSEGEQAEQAEDFRTRPEETGFYSWGPKGGKVPAYDALLRQYGEDNPYITVADMKSVFLFNGTHYVDTTPIEIKGYAERLMDPKPEEKVRAEFLAKVFSNNIRRRGFFTESIEGKINFKNGVLDLHGSDSELLPHSADYGFQGVLPYEFDPEAKCPVFRAWFKSIMLDDRDLMRLLQEFMGYIVRGGEYKYHKALWLGGVGRNGKSTFIDLLKALIGPGNFSVTSIKSLVGDKFSAQCLDGKFANFSEETSPEELSDSGPFKNLTGDGDLQAQKKFGNLYTFRNRAKLVMTYNQIPNLKDLSSGMLSRPIIIPFRKIIKEEEQDRDIKAKLFAELPGIFNFALRGWNRLEEQGGFTTSSVSETALQSVREESCNVFQWVQDHVEAAPESVGGKAFRSNELYEIYKRCERFPFRSSEFYRRLANHPTMSPLKKRYNTGIEYRYIKVF